MGMDKGAFVRYNVIANTRNTFWQIAAKEDNMAFFATPNTSVIIIAAVVAVAIVIGIIADVVSSRRRSRRNSRCPTPP